MQDKQSQDWAIDETHSDRNRFKKYGRKHPREIASCLSNLDAVVGYLNRGEALGSFRMNFLRRESGDVWRIGQTGISGAKETRLYILALVVGRTIYVLTVGDKDTQEADLKECKKMASAIQRGLTE